MIKELPVDLIEWAYQRVKDLLVEGELKPGEPIRQVQLAEKLGISRTPLIKALQQLTNENFLKHQPRKGFVVRQYGAEEMLKLHRLREACEAVAAYDTCKRASNEQIDDLFKLFAPFINITEWTDQMIDKYQKADIKFHNSIVELSDNHFLSQALKNTGFLYLTYQRGLLQHPSVTLQIHLEIIESFRARDPEKSQRLIEKHLRIGRDNIHKLFE